MNTEKKLWLGYRPRREWRINMRWARHFPWTAHKKTCVCLQCFYVEPSWVVLQMEKRARKERRNHE
jgi:hypothetical protein